MAGALRTKVQPGVVPPELPTAAGRARAAVEILRTTETIDAVGTVEARHKADVASQLLATIREVKVNAGDRVEVEELLVVLDDRELQAQLREAEAAAAGARADRDVRERDFRRYQQMFREKAVTKEDYDRVEGAYKGADAQLKRIAEQAARVKVMLTYTEVKAQAAGIVGRRHVDPGDLAVPSKPLLTLYDSQERELHASVPESLASAVKLNMELPVRVEAINCECRGVVREISPQAQPTSRSVLVKVTLPPQVAGRAYVGMFGRLAIPTGQTERIVVPAAAVQEVGQQDLVDVIRKDNTLQRRFVTVGRRYGDKVEILSGLNVGEEVALPEQ
jgi:RND family efflux transporter MFP subunit